MIAPPKPEPRDEKRFAQELRERLVGYLPAWRPGERGADAALLAIAARFFSSLGTRLNKAPDKNLLAFLETAGIERIPAQSARAPIVCVTNPAAADGRLPQHSRITAPPPPGRNEEIVFETETDLGLAAARLVEVVSIHPGRDEFADLSAAHLAGLPFTIFSGLTLSEHSLYLGHRRILNLAGEVTVKVSFSLAAGSSERLSIQWTYWDGKVWRPFENVLEKCDEEAREDVDGTNGLMRSGSVTLKTGCAETQPRTVNGVDSFWVKGTLLEPLPVDPTQVLPLVESIKLQTVITQSLHCTKQQGTQNDSVDCPLVANDSLVTLKAGLLPDKAFAGAEPLDLTKAFYPLGQQPVSGSVFYFTSAELFSKPNARAQFFMKTAPTPEQTLNDQDPTLTPEVIWEYWNGTDWVALPPPNATGSTDPANFLHNGVFNIVVPRDMRPLKVNEEEALWMRVRLVSGNYVSKKTVTTDTSSFSFFLPRPPALADFRFGYTWESAREAPEATLAFNDFQYQDFTILARYAGRTFPPFSQMGDRTPTLYLGFDKKLPVDFLGLFFNIFEEPGGEEGPALVWEYWDGSDWRRLEVLDETGGFSRPGMLSLIGAEDAGALARFGASRYWLRGRLREDGPPPRNVFNAIYLNAVWASQKQTIRDENLGDSSGEPQQSFQFSHFPVLTGEVVEVREIAGELAQIEYAILRDELGEERVRAVIDPVGKITEVWVRWENRAHLFFSKATDRHYMMDRAEGRLIFGDDTNGKIPPPAALITAREYRAGGGKSGNVPARTIKQAPGGTAVVEVFNALPAEGGTDAEPVTAIASRGPRTIRHRGRAMTARDYEVMALEAAPEVAWVRVFPASDVYLGRRPGHVVIMLLPETEDRRPWPSFGLRERVRKHIEERALASLCVARCIHVTGPQYFPIDVEVTVVPQVASAAGIIEKRVRTALENFLHPLHGGPHRNGWELGRDVFLSDIAAVIEGLTGVDVAKEIVLLRDNSPQGDHIAVPRDRLVVAGEIRVKVQLT